MTGLFTGIIGSLIGAGIQATVGGIPISEDASKALDVLRTGGLPVPPTNWFSPTISDRGNNRQIQVYDRIEQHVTGAHQVLNSCIRIARVLEDVAHQRSAPKPAEAWTPQGEFNRAETSFCTGKSASANHPVPVKVANKIRGCQCVNASETTLMKTSILSGNESVERREKVSGNPKSVEDNRRMRIEKSATSSSSKNIAVNIKKENFYEKSNNNKENSLPLDKVSEFEKKDKFWERDEKRNRFMSSTNVDFEYSREGKFCGSSSAVTVKQSSVQRGQNQSVNSLRQYSNKAVIGTCQICRAQIRKNNKSKTMPCGHMFCQGCLNGRKILKCSECCMKF